MGFLEIEVYKGIWCVMLFLLLIYRSGLEKYNVENFDVNYKGFYLMNLYIYDII